MMRVVVIDDEPLSRRGVIARLKREPDVEIVGEAADGASGLAVIERLQPDLIFIDIAMPGLDGMSAVAALPVERRPLVVFVSAHDQFAVRAFEVRALDYLLKPIDGDRFAESVARARAAAAQSTSPAPERPPLTRFPIRVGSREEVVSADDIHWIEADGDYATLHAGARQYLLREPIRKLVDQLDPAQFVRIHRSTIVRVSQVAEVQSLTNRDATLRLADGTMLRVSRTYTQALKDALFRWGRG
ncbi:LytR/AlgR family response regulator transcription factor [Pinirhizobacter soli]|uniref:LytR/AlgR family response regulator transcription factor n=1 Tax=Pinirhizobacter soli TaxID=2786953 RepID=UPI00202A2ED3|nr:LytTR family DNA-binding domain-containing protein [Pinirhizobacter soli]